MVIWKKSIECLPILFKIKFKNNEQMICLNYQFLGWGLCIFLNSIMNKQIIHLNWNTTWFSLSSNVIIFIYFDILQHINPIIWVSSFQISKQLSLLMPQVFTLPWEKFNKDKSHIIIYNNIHYQKIDIWWPSIRFYQNLTVNKIRGEENKQ